MSTEVLPARLALLCVVVVLLPALAHPQGQAGTGELSPGSPGSAASRAAQALATLAGMVDEGPLGIDSIGALSADEILEVLLASPEWTVPCTPQEARNREALVASARGMSSEARLVAARLLSRLPLTYTEEFPGWGDDDDAYWRHGDSAERLAPVPLFAPDHLRMDVGIFEDTVRLALRAREELPWCAELDREMFIRHVVVHRGTSEALENWRAYFWGQGDLHGAVSGYADTYRQASTQEARSQVVCELIHYLNTQYLGSKCRYAPRGMPDLAPSQLLDQGVGRCTDLTNALLAVCRTYGLAAVGVRTIWWPRGDSNHNWAAIYDPAAQEWHDVNGAGGGPVSSGYLKVGREGGESHAKVYWLDMGAVRGPIRRALAGSQHPGAITHYLMGLSQMDMTDRYTQVGTIEQRSDLAAGTPVYLCCFNTGQWREVAATRAGEDGTVRFEKVGCRDGVLYLLRYRDEARGSLMALGRPGVLTARPHGAEWKGY